MRLNREIEAVLGRSTTMIATAMPYGYCERRLYNRDDRLRTHATEG
jgi:hypothetical protein